LPRSSDQGQLPQNRAGEIPAEAGI
jgi:hypothetical protein